MTCKYPTPNIKITSNLFHGIDILNHDAINLASLEAIVWSILSEASSPSHKAYSLNPH